MSSLNRTDHSWIFQGPIVHAQRRAQEIRNRPIMRFDIDQVVSKLVLAKGRDGQGCFSNGSFSVSDSGGYLPQHLC
jgi:hypothetical protein